VAKRTDDRRWYHQSLDGGTWLGGAHNRDDAIGDALAEGEFPVRIAFGRKVHGAALVPTAAQIMDVMWQYSMQQFGDAAKDFPNVGKDAERELDRLLKRWADKHIAQVFWDIGPTECVVGAGG